MKTSFAFEMSTGQPKVSEQVAPFHWAYSQITQIYGCRRRRLACNIVRVILRLFHEMELCRRRGRGGPRARGSVACSRAQQLSPHHAEMPPGFP